MAHVTSGSETTDAETPAEDPQLVATGALQGTLLAHRGAWVRGHVEIVELRDPRRVRRRSIVDLELPPVGSGSPVVPLGVLPKGIESGVEIRDASGAPVQLVDPDLGAVLAAAGLLALARGVGAD